MPLHPSAFHNRPLRQGAVLSCILLAHLGLIGPEVGQLQSRPGDDYSESRKLESIGLPINLRDKMNSELMAEITELDRACHLSVEQRHKLRLMGQGDIKHYFALVRECQEGREVSLGPRYGLVLMAEGGLFHEYSLFGKSIRNVLDSKQQALREPLATAASRKLHDNAVNSLLRGLESIQPFAAGERDRYLALLKKVPPIVYAGDAGLLCLVLHLKAVARKHPDISPKGKHRDWLNGIDDRCKTLTPFLQEAGYLQLDEMPEDKK